jgi:hypothetical protein
MPVSSGGAHLFLPTGAPVCLAKRAYFHDAENVVEALWRALCSGIVILVATLRLKIWGHLRRGIGAEAASVAKGDLRQGDFCSRLCETRVITGGTALA